TYYMFGYDDISPKQPVNLKLMSRGGSGGKIVHIQETDQDGKVLANPIYYSENVNKWVIGNDPADSALIETTSFALGSGWGASRTPAFMPGDFTKFFIRVVHTANKIQGVRKMVWVPNGQSQFDVSWADNGLLSWGNVAGANMGSAADQAGPSIVGDNLYTANNLLRETTQGHTDIAVIDWKGGTLDRNIDITEWWSDPGDFALKANLNGGPNGIVERNGKLFLNCHCSCLKQMVDPAAESDEDFVVWTNDNGDYIVDHNFSPESSRKWACNDLSVGPYNYHISPDVNLFSLLPSYDIGSSSFALLGPDGDGIGYFSYANDTAGWKWYNHIVDSGSAYDGIYCDDQQRVPVADTFKINQPGMYYIAHDSIKGTIGTQIGVKDAAPAAFAVAQNTPNPFNPTTTISFTLAKAGKTTVEVFNAAGQKVDTILNANLSAGSHSVVWNAAGNSAGVYFYTVRNGEFSRTVKMTLLK
ncbi:MAG: T9SS type A sorting domain-containing protein, partial [Candidatus Latescibacterota bacterium]